MEEPAREGAAVDAAIARVLAAEAAASAAIEACAAAAQQRLQAAQREIARIEERAGRRLQVLVERFATRALEDESRLDADAPATSEPVSERRLECAHCVEKVAALLTGGQP
jgi:hypothetical protein